MPTPSPLLTVGWREWVALPELGIPALKAKIDTGARTSALHAFQVDVFRERDRERVRFGVHPLRNRPEVELFCTADVLDRRIVRDSGGHRTKRIVIRTPIRIGDHSWPIEVTLTARDTMLFRMLLGRTAMQQRLLVDPGQSYYTGRALAGAYRHHG